MLSYKLKHLCSQMFASLAAFGLFSLGGGEARADYKDPSGTFNFAGSAANFTVTAAYTDDCSLPSSYNGISGVEYKTASGSGSGYCLYTCKQGYYYNDGSSEYTGMTGVTGTDGKSQPPANCYPKPSSCSNATWNAAGAYITNTNNNPSIKFTVGKGYYCTATCKDGFGKTATSAAGTSSMSSFATTTGVLSVPACVGRNFTMTVDCGSGTYSGSTSSKGTVDATYGMKITLPGSGACSWAGHTFSGFNVPASAISK